MDIPFGVVPEVAGVNLAVNCYRTGWRSGLRNDPSWCITYPADILDETKVLCPPCVVEFSPSALQRQWTWASQAYHPNLCFPLNQSVSL